MKKRIGKQVLSGVLAAAMLTTTAWSGLSVSARYTKEESDRWAGTEDYYYRTELGQNQAWVHSYTPQDIMDWSPETDPYAEYNRARVPLQERNGQNVATQANQKLKDEASVLVLAGDYQNENDDMWNAGYLTQYNTYFSRYLFNFWQYVDYYGTWHGELTQNVPESMLGVADNNIMKSFEHGYLMLPNPAYTNAAHKNGAMSIAVIAPEPTKKSQLYSELLQKDEEGNYIMADKLIEMKEYYGFDGYFLNEEDSKTFTEEEMTDFKKLMQYMMENGCYVQWYDAVNAETGRGQSYQNRFNQYNSPFVQDEELGRVSDSIFLNYWWYSRDYVTSSVAHAESLGLDPLETVFFGIEGGGNRWSQNMGDIANLLDDTGNAIASLAIIGSDMPNDVGTDADGVYRNKYKNENQWKIFERERIWWSGPSQDPTNTGEIGLTREDLGIRNSNWDGVASVIAEKSVVGGNTFYTNFNTGHGLKYYLDGEVSNGHEWNNINIQDILPTWQWWIDTEGTRLQADFDYGTGYDKGTQQNYTTVDPYKGGSSLVVSGKLDAQNFLRLYKSDLSVNENTEATLVFRKTSDDTATMKLGLLFEGEEDNLVTVDIDNTAAKSDAWVTSTVDLSDYAGKHIAAFGLVFDGKSDMYQMNIGELKITDGSAVKPNAPTGLQIDKAHETGEMNISWNLDSYDTVKQYNVYATINGQRMYMGGTYDEVFYIKDLYNPTGEVTIELTAVGADGTESDPAKVTWNYGSGLPEITVTAEDGKLNVGYGSGSADITVTTKYEAIPRTWSAAGTDGQAVVEVAGGADADGAYYSMEIKLADGRIVHYDGQLDDSYCEPYEGKFKDYALSYPTSHDWYKIHYQEVEDLDAGKLGEEKTMTVYIELLPTISRTAEGMYVTLEDYEGNLSEKVYIPNQMSVTVESEEDWVQASRSLQFTATVKNYASDSSVTWSVSGNTSNDTGIDENGLLTVGADELSRNLTVKATSNEDPDFSGTKTVTIEAAILLNPKDGEVYKGETLQMAVENLGVDMGAENFNWEITSTVADGTTLDETGRLTVDPQETANWISIKATNKTNDKMVLTGTYTVKPSVTLALKDAKFVEVGKDVSFILTYKGEEAAASDFEWSISSNDAGVGELNEATVIKDGVLSVAAEEKAMSITVTVTKKDNDRAVASLNVSVRENLDKDVAKDKTILGSSDEWAYNLENLIDGDEDTSFYAYEENGWVVIDLGKRYEINRWKTVNNGEGDEANKKYALEILVDEGSVSEEDLADKAFLANDENWEEVDLVENNTAQVVNRPLDPTVSARYVRIRVDEGYSMYGFYSCWGFNEIEIFADRIAVDKEVTGVTVEPGIVTVDAGDTQQFTATVEAQDPQPVVTEVELTASAASGIPGDTVTLTAKVKGSNLTDKSVSWKLENAQDVTTSLADGILTIGEDEPVGELTVTATANADETKSATVTIKVLEKPDEKAIALTGDAIVQSENIQTNTGNSWEDVEYMLDGDLSTKATAAGQQGSAGTEPNAYLIVDVGEANAAKGITSIDAYAALDKSNPSTRFGAKTVKVSYADSVDGPFTEAATIELNAEEGYWDNESAYANHVVFTEPIHSRYIKYEVVEWYGGWRAIWDITLYASNKTGSNVALRSNGIQAFAGPIEDDPEELVQKVVWSVEGNKSANTTIDETGLLTVAGDESAKTLIVRATSVIDSAKYGEAEVTVRQQGQPAQQYDITVNVTGEGAANADRASAKAGETVTLNVLPKEGSRLESITVNNGEVQAVKVSDTVYTFVMPARAAVVAVTFAAEGEPTPPAPEKPAKPYEPATEYYINVVAGEHGTVTPGSGMYAIGSKQSFTIKPDAGYEIDSVLVDGKETGVNGGVLTLYVNEPYRVTVTFKEAAKQPGIDVSTPGSGSTTATPNPQTGDSLPVGMLAALALAAGSLIVLRKRVK